VPLTPPGFWGNTGKNGIVKLFLAVDWKALTVAVWKILLPVINFMDLGNIIAIIKRVGRKSKA
jgi:hypothetical protein